MECLRDWQAVILKDIDVLPKVGIPGTTVVFGKSAAPILTGESEADVLIAAAEVGEGRIVTIAHDGYGTEFQANNSTSQAGIDATIQKLHRNLKTFLTKGTWSEGDCVVDSGGHVSDDDLTSAKIVIWLGGEGNIRPESIREFVQNGGALLHCMTPWGWMQLNGGKSISSAPYVGFLAEAGLCYTDEYVNVADDGFVVKDNKAKSAHLLSVFKEKCDLETAFEYAHLTKQIKHLPKHECAQQSHLLEAYFKHCHEKINKCCIVPSQDHKIKDKANKCILELWLACAKILQLTNMKAPGVLHFPGDFSTEPSLQCVVLEITADKEDYHSTACYLPPGKMLEVEVISGNVDNDWQVMVGCHSDHLTNTDESLRRWPQVNETHTLHDKILNTWSPFGGLVYLISPDKPDCHIKVMVKNVVESPQFRVGDGEKKWQLSRQTPGLWADLIGEHVMITFPADSVRKLDAVTLTSNLRKWDSVVSLYHELRGTDVAKYRQQWIVADEQPVVGYMHAGYPIVTHLDVSDPTNDGFLLDGKCFHDAWGIFHEIGHNMQEDEWTFDGTVEVTCNIFTLFAMDKICNRKTWIHSWLQDQLGDTQQYLEGGADFEVWKNSPGIALFIYAQLIHEFGWECYKQVFRRYVAMPASEKPEEDGQKMDTWFLIFSEVSGYSLAPMTSFWNIPLSAEMVERLKGAFQHGFLPDDEITNLAPQRVTAVLSKFPNTVRKSLKKV